MSVKQLGVLGVVVFFMGCPTGPTSDAGTQDSGSTPSCDCAVNGNSLTVSWECFCAKYGCEGQPAATCPGPYDTTSLACGLRVETRYPGGVTRVFDATGVQVGGAITPDIGPTVCPDDASLTGGAVSAGVFPDAGCAVTTCDCIDGGVACPGVDQL